MAHTSNSDKRARGGRSCVAGGPNLTSCTNTQHDENVSFHRFPSEKTDRNRRMKWVNFVRKHRPLYQPSATASLCSVHFEDSCYNLNRTLAKSLNMNRRLKDDVIPTIDVAGIVSPAEEQTTERKQRAVSV